MCCVETEGSTPVFLKEPKVSLKFSITMHMLFVSLSSQENVYKISEFHRKFHADINGLILLITDHCEDLRFQQLKCMRFKPHVGFFTR